MIDVVYLEFSEEGQKSSLQSLLDLLQTTKIELLREIGQTHRFAILQDNRGEAVDYDSLPGRLAPADIRPHRPYDVKASAGIKASDLVVLTHIDVPPPSLPALEELYRPFMAASRAEQGARGFDLLQSPARPNHFTLVECWASPSSAQAHSTAAHTLEFRKRLTPLLGALYDQRVYTRVPSGLTDSRP